MENEKMFQNSRQISYYNSLLKMGYSPEEAKAETIAWAKRCEKVKKIVSKTFGKY